MPRTEAFASAAFCATLCCLAALSLTMRNSGTASYLQVDHRRDE